MFNRKEHDADVDDLHAGACTPGDPRFVPEHLRADYAAIDRVTEAKLARELRRIQTVMRDIPGRGHVVLAPNDRADDEETALVWRKIDHAALQLDARRRQEAHAAAERAQYSCSCCGNVRPPIVRDGRHTKPRPFDGRPLHVCGDCADVLEVLVRERRAGELVADGKTRRAAAAALLEHTSR